MYKPLKLTVNVFVKYTKNFCFTPNIWNPSVYRTSKCVKIETTDWVKHGEETTLSTTTGCRRN